MPTPVVDAQDVMVCRAGRTIVEEIDLTVAPGERVLIQGASGAGKSTLFEVLGLLAPPSAGEVRIDGVATTNASERRRAALRAEILGFVFQEFNLIPELTARENAAVPQEHVDDADPAWIDELFELLALTPVADQRPATLSGGEKQRVAIARALANRPAAVLADEPTGQLDPETTERVLDLLDQVQETAGTALLVVSHDPAVADRFERVHELIDGRLHAATPAAHE